MFTEYSNIYDDISRNLRSKIISNSSWNSNGFVNPLSKFFIHPARIHIQHYQSLFFWNFNNISTDVRRNISVNFCLFAAFFNYQLTFQRPTLNHSRADSLTSSMLITGSCTIFDPKVTGNLLVRFTPQTWLNNYWDLEKQPSDLNVTPWLEESLFPSSKNK